MKEIIQRLKSKSPKLFRRLLRFSISLMAIAASLLGLESSNNITLPFWISKGCEYAIIAGTVAMGVSKLTVEGGYENEGK